MNTPKIGNKYVPRVMLKHKGSFDVFEYLGEYDDSRYLFTIHVRRGIDNVAELQVPYHLDKQLFHEEFISLIE